MENKTKGILCLIGAVVLHLALGSSYAWGNLNFYLVSFLKYHGLPDILNVDGFFILPLNIFATSLCIGFGGSFESRFGIRFTLILGLILVITPIALLYVLRAVLFIDAAFIFSGFGVGLCYMAPIRNLWKYYPEKKGMVSGIVVSGFGLSSMIINAFADNYMNPEHKQPYISSKNSYYTEDIADRFLSFIVILVAWLIALGILAIFFAFPYVEESDCSKIKLVNEGFSSTSDSQTELDFKKIILRKEFFFSIIIGFCTTYFPYLMVNVQKTFGALNNISSAIISATVIAFGLINGGSRVIWGVLFDYSSFKLLYFCIVCLEILISASIYYLAEYGVVYLILNLILAALLGGNFALFPSFISKVFGVKYSSEVYGFVFVGFGCSTITGAILSKFVIKETGDYLTVMLIGTGLAVVSFVLLFFIKEEAIVASEENKNISNEKDQI